METPQRRRAVQLGSLRLLQSRRHSFVVSSSAAGRHAGPYSFPPRVSWRSGFVMMTFEKARHGVNRMQEDRR